MKLKVKPFAGLKVTRGYQQRRLRRLRRNLKELRDKARLQVATIACMRNELSHVREAISYNAGLVRRLSRRVSR